MMSRRVVIQVESGSRVASVIQPPPRTPRAPREKPRAPRRRPWQGEVLLLVGFYALDEADAHAELERVAAGLARRRLPLKSRPRVLSVREARGPWPGGEDDGA